MAINYHKHLFNCENNKSTRYACIACKWEEWNSSKKKTSVIGKTFEQRLTEKDAELLQGMLISRK